LPLTLHPRQRDSLVGEDVWMIQGLLKDVSEQERQLAAGDKEDEDLGEVNAAKEDDKETMY